MRTGADISHWQGSFDAARYKASGEDFIILKATENNNFTDATFAERWRSARSVGLPRTAYHFARPGQADGDVQADYFINAVRNAGWAAEGNSWALDLEANDGGLSSTQLIAWADRWCMRVRAALGGRGLFYTYPAFWNTRMGNPTTIPGGALGWWARYGATPYDGLGFTVRGFTNPPAVWQCSNGQSGCVKDVASIGRCDYNRMTDAAFAELFTGGEPDVTPDEHDALMALDNKIVEMAEQACRRTVHAIMTGGTGAWANPARSGWEFYTPEVQASATRRLVPILDALGREHDAHTDMLTALAPAALVQSILSGLVAQGVVIPADIDHQLLVEDMKLALQGMTQKFEPIGFDG